MKNLIISLLFMLTANLSFSRIVCSVQNNRGETMKSCADCVVANHSTCVETCSDIKWQCTYREPSTHFEMTGRGRTGLFDTESEARSAAAICSHGRYVCQDIQCSTVGNRLVPPTTKNCPTIDDICPG